MEEPAIIFLGFVVLCIAVLAAIAMGPAPNFWEPMVRMPNGLWGPISQYPFHQQIYGDGMYGADGVQHEQ